jgi:hypothetical protein
MAELHIGPITINQTTGENVGKTLEEWGGKGVAALQGLMKQAAEGIQKATETQDNSTGSTNSTVTTEARVDVLDAAPALPESSGNSTEVETPEKQPETTAPEAGDAFEAASKDNELEYSLDFDTDESLPVTRYQSKVGADEEEGKACKEQLYNADIAATKLAESEVFSRPLGDFDTGVPAAEPGYSDGEAWKLVNKGEPESECKIQILKSEQLGEWEQLGRANFSDIFSELTKGGVLPIAEGMPVGNLAPVLKEIEAARETLEAKLKAASTDEERKAIKDTWDTVDDAINDLLEGGEKDVKALTNKIIIALGSVSLSTDAITQWQSAVLVEAKEKLELKDYGSAGLPGLYWGQLISNKALDLPTGNQPLGIRQVLKLEREEGKPLPKLMAERGVFTSDEMLAKYYYGAIQAFLAVESNAALYSGSMSEPDYGALIARFTPDADGNWPPAPKPEDYPNADYFNHQAKAIYEEGEEVKDVDGGIITDDDMADIGPDEAKAYRNSEDAS